MFGCVRAVGVQQPWVLGDVLVPVDDVDGGAARDAIDERGVRVVHPVADADDRVDDHLPVRPDDVERLVERRERGVVLEAAVAALAVDAELLVPDEPTSGLDPLMEAQFATCVREATRRCASVLLSSHILAEVESLCDTVTSATGSPGGVDLRGVRALDGHVGRPPGRLSHGREAGHPEPMRTYIWSDISDSLIVA